MSTTPAQLGKRISRHDRGLLFYLFMAPWAFIMLAGIAIAALILIIPPQHQQMWPVLASLGGLFAFAGAFFMRGNYRVMHTPHIFELYEYGVRVIERRGGASEAILYEDIDNWVILPIKFDIYTLQFRRRGGAWLKVAAGTAGRMKLITSLGRSAAQAQLPALLEKLGAGSAVEFSYEPLENLVWNALEVYEPELVSRACLVLQADSVALEGRTVPFTALEPVKYGDFLGQLKLKHRNRGENVVLSWTFLDRPHLLQAALETLTRQPQHGKTLQAACAAGWLQADAIQSSHSRPARGRFRRLRDVGVVCGIQLLTQPRQHVVDEYAAFAR